ncbi:MAG: threonine synthase, partial [Clostridia bacterium]|nr:threonine synthase [Clostridia bacterium]
INWGRLVPQIVYYISAYCDLVKDGKISLGDEINFCVPTGNFGNIFAAYLAKLMGLPIARLICASNMNNVLTDFLESGTYDKNRKFHITMSPSMDILISSNLERLLYFCAGAEETSLYMKSLSETGKYTVSADVKSKIDQLFSGYYSDESETAKTIKNTFEKHGYLCDTHTAVGVSAAERYCFENGDNRVTVVDSTASPYKFAADVYTALGQKSPEDPLDALEALSKYTGTEIAYPLKGLGEREIRFKKIIESSEMSAEVLNFAK